MADDDAAFRTELTQQTYDLTREGPRAAPPKKPAQPAPVPAMPTHDAEHTALGLTAEQAAAA